MSVAVDTTTWPSVHTVSDLFPRQQAVPEMLGAVWALAGSVLSARNCTLAMGALATFTFCVFYHPHKEFSTGNRGRHYQGVKRTPRRQEE